MVTGTTNSRLIELRKYTVTGSLTDRYVSGGSAETDGIDAALSTFDNVIYYLGGIRFNDVLDTATNIVTTTYEYTPEGINNPNFITRFIYKDPNKENIISLPKIDNDVFIKRQEVSAFDMNYRLEFINNLVDIETYAGGNFFNIIKNS